MLLSVLLLIAPSSPCETNTKKYFLVFQRADIDISAKLFKLSVGGKSKLVKCWKTNFKQKIKTVIFFMTSSEGSCESFRNLTGVEMCVLISY